MADLVPELAKDLFSWVEENPITTLVLLVILVILVYLIRRKYF